MPTFRPGDVVRAPFPYTDRDTRQFRPAVVIASALGDQKGLCWVLMITSASNRPWAGDVGIPDHHAVGLPAPSVIRTAKIATVEAARIDGVGRLAAVTWHSVRVRLAEVLSDAD